MDCANKTYVVTGATSGIGLATAEELVRAGAHVIGVGRSPERCKQAEARLRGLAPGSRVDYLLANLSVQAEVKSLAARISDLQASYGSNAMDGLVNNAGVFTYWFTQTPDGIEMQWAVNHLAPFLLTRLLLPLLEQAPFARVVTVSSDSHFNTQINWADPQLRRHYNGLQAYGTTKLANILFTLELNNRLGAASGVRAFAVDPGLVNTDIGMKGTPPLAGWVWKLRRKGGTAPQVPARGILYLLSQPDIQNSGALYWKDSRPKPSSRVSVDAHSAGRLWTLSGQLCGLI
jgi:NAD(P)-dependent dehydrogenase (short-subunit alcohol dehydrogenase family)